MRVTAAVLLLVPAACGGAEQQGPTLPPLALEPLLATFAARAAEDLALDQAQHRQLWDLLETAFLPDYADASLRERAKRSLLAEDDAFLVLEAGLAHENATVRSFCAYELGGLERQESILPLLWRQKEENYNPQVLLWVAAALGELGNGSGLADLRRLLDRPATIGAAAQRALDLCGKWGVALPEVWDYGDLRRGLLVLEERFSATGTLRPDGASAPPTPRSAARVARHLVALDGPRLRPVDNARFVLSRAGTLAVAQLVAATRASEGRLRTHVLEILRDLGPLGAAAADAVLPLIRDPLSRMAAVNALGGMAARGAVTHLLAVLDGTDQELRTAAAEALGRIGGAGVAVRLAALVADRGEAMDVRVRAAFGLALLVPKRPGRLFLEKCLEDELYHEPTLRELLSELGKKR